ncbi:MAG: fluoride efflux transporter CrcB [Chitinophagaceae bacterium]|jgi:CrcB protein
MINNLLIVGIGGAAGSMLRYIIQLLLNITYPVGTILVNLTGCFLIGILWGFLTKNYMSEPLRLLYITGFCGGFTTFSAFTVEGNQMLSEGRWSALLIYLTISVAGGFILTFFGFKLFNT